MRPTWRVFCGIVALSASMLLAGCGTSGNSNVRAVNASPTLNSFTLQVGTIGIVSDLPYGEVGVQPQGTHGAPDTSGKYRAIGAGTKQNVVVYQGTPTNVLGSQTLTLVKGTSYTFVTFGTAPSIGILTLTDNGAPPSSGDFGLRVVDTAGSAGPVDIYLTTPGEPLTGLTPILSGVTAGSVTQYLPEAPGSIAVQVTPHGNQGSVLIDETVNPTSGQLVTAFILDPPAGGGPGQFGLLLTTDAGAAPAKQ